MTALRELAANLRAARERAGLSMEQLDDLAGLSRGSVEAFELTQGAPSVRVLSDLARALDVPVAELLEGVS